MIVAILPDASRTEILLNNLSEAEFDLDDVSVIMEDVKQRTAIAKDTGPLKRVGLPKIPQALRKAGVSSESAERCYQSVLNGKVLVVMNVAEPYRGAAEEMFQDHSAQLIKG
jgi:propanediol dehydratase small subunit